MSKKIALALLALSTPTFAHANALGGFDVMSFLPIVMIFAVFYFLLLRPQQKKAKVHQEMVQNLRRGDRIVTSGGIVATVSRVVNDNEAIIEVEDQVKLRVIKSAISEVVSKSEPVTTSEVAQFPKVAAKPSQKSATPKKPTPKTPVKKAAASKAAPKKGK